MSVRRLAEDQVQPDAFSFNAENALWAQATIRKYPEGRQQSAVIPLLMRAQEQDGWVTRAAIEFVANMLDMPLIRVLEVATFYTQFQLKPVGTRAHVQVCGTTPCMLRGAEDLINVCKSKIHHDPLELNADGTLSWEEVECQGACVNAPMVMIFKDSYEDLTAEGLEQIIDRFQAGEGASVKTGPQIERIFSAPEGGLTSLTEVIQAPSKKAPEKAQPADATASVPPANAAKPKTDADETNPALKTPADGKTAEPGAGPAKPAHSDASPASDEIKQPISDTAAVDAGGEAPKDAANVGKPSTDAPENNPALKTPADGKSAAPGGAPVKPARKSAKPASDEIKQPISDTAAADAAGTAPKAPQPSLEDTNRPAGIDRPATPDDLKLISGVGPKIEGILNGLGIYNFSQVAAWNSAERAWVDGYLRFAGRIERDNWVKQAEALAKGGEAEYIRVFGKKPR